MNNKIIHILVTILSVTVVCISAKNIDTNKPIKLMGDSENWDITLTIEDKQSNLKIDPKDSVLNSDGNIYYSYNLYKNEDIILAVRYDFLNYKNPIVERQVGFGEDYKNEIYEIEIEFNDIRETISLNKIL